MKPRPRLVPVAALAALLLPVGAAWLVHRGSVPRFEATARLLLPVNNGKVAAVDLSGAEVLSVEEDVLSPEVVSRTIDLLEARQVTVAPDPVRLSLSDILLDRLHVDPKSTSDSQEVVVRYHTTAKQEAVAVLSAVLDAVVELSGSQALTPGVQAAAADDDERELEQLDEAIRRRRDLVNGAERHCRQATNEEAARRAQQEKLKLLGQAVAEAHRKRIEAENRFQQAEQDVAAGVPVELLAARLPDGELHAFVNELFSREKHRRELRDRQERLQQLAGIYGRNHPAVRELQTRIAELLQEVAAETRPSDGGAELSPAQMFLQALQGAWRETQASETDLQDELAAETAVMEEDRGAEQALAEHRDELKFLESERTRVQQRLDKSRRDVVAAAVTISQPAALNPQPISTGIGLYLAVGGGVGISLCLAVLWTASRRRNNEVARTTAPRDQPAYRRFFSHEERRLVQMKSMAAAVDVG